MNILLKFILLALFFYVVFRLLRMVFLIRRTGASPDARATRDRAQHPPRVDKTKATEADFEEIKNK